MITLLPAAVIFAIYIVNVKNAYDFSLDEITYASVTQNVIGEGAITTAVSPFLVHPPMYFLVGGLWNLITGNQHDSPLQAIYSLRYLQAILVGLSAWVVGLVTVSATRAAGVRDKVWQPIAAMAVYALSGFVLSFGRAVILESMAVLAGGLILLAALRLRNSPGLYQICALGALIGVGCLVKQTVIFAGLAPLLAGIVRLDWRTIRIQLGAIVVGALVWSSFLLWGVTQGHGHAFIDQQTVSFRRLIGVLQTSGVNHTGSGTAGALDDVKATFAQYMTGYIVFFGGALALLLLVAQRRLFSRRNPLPVAHHLVLSFGVLQYVFVAFSFAFGQGNQQLIMYSAAAGAIAIGYSFSVFGADEWRHGFARGLRPVVGLFAAVGIIGGAVTFVYFYAMHDDNGTTRMASFINSHYSGCVPINASGDKSRWSAVLPTKDVTSFNNAPDALDQGTRLFLVSTKDAEHAYGNMSPQFAHALAVRGTVVHKLTSRSYDTIDLVRVGPASGVRPDPKACAAAAARRNNLPHVQASAGVFASILGGALVVVGAVAALGGRIRRRRRPDGRHEQDSPPQEVIPDDQPTSTIPATE